MAKEIKIITKNWEIPNISDIESYLNNGGYLALKKVLREMSPSEVLSEVKISGLNGRGGAGFLVGKKWELAKEQKTKEKYFICNLDESEPGNFKDRLIGERNPHQLIEGIIISCYAIGAQKAFIYLNGKFKQLERILKIAIEACYKEGLLGRSIMGFAFDLELEIFCGAGAYICGEESALVASISGQRGEPSVRPPFPCQCGLDGKPTVVNNAETIANLPWIIKNGGKKFSLIGMKESPGTKLVCLDGSVKKPGVYEIPIGFSVEEVINNQGGGIKPGTEFWFAQVGGASGNLVPAKFLGEMPSYAKTSKIPLGTGSILVFDKFQDIKKIMLSWINFFQRESCGKCVPCREGTFRLKSILERLADNQIDRNDLEDLEKLIWTLDHTTFCALGKFSVNAIKDVIRYGFCPELASGKENNF